MAVLLNRTTQSGEEIGFDDTEVNDAIFGGDFYWPKSNGPMYLRGRNNEFVELKPEDAQSFGQEFIRGGYSYVSRTGAEHYQQNGNWPTTTSLTDAIVSGGLSGATVTLSKLAEGREAFTKQRDWPKTYLASEIVGALLTTKAGAYKGLANLWGRGGQLKSMPNVARDVLLGNAPEVIRRGSQASMKEVLGALAGFTPSAISSKAASVVGQGILRKGFGVSGAVPIGAREAWRTGLGPLSTATAGAVEGFIWGAGAGLTEATVMRDLGMDDMGQIGEYVLETARKNAIFGFSFSGAISVLAGLPALIPAGVKATAGAWDWASEVPVLHAARQTYLKTIAETHGYSPERVQKYLALADTKPSSREMRDSLKATVANLNDYFEGVAGQVQNTFNINAMVSGLDRAPWREDYVADRLTNAETIKTLLIAHADLSDVINELSANIGDNYDIQWDGPRPVMPEVEERSWHVPEYARSEFPLDREKLIEVRGQVLGEYKRMFGPDGHFTNRLRHWIRETSPEFDPNNLGTIEDLTREIFRHRLQLEEKIDLLGEFVPDAIVDLQGIRKPFQDEFNLLAAQIEKEGLLEFGILDSDYPGQEALEGESGISARGEIDDAGIKAYQDFQVNNLEQIKDRREETTRSATPEAMDAWGYLDPDTQQLFSLLDTEMRSRYPEIDEPFEDYLRSRGAIPINNSLKSMVNFARAVAKDEPIIPMLPGWWGETAQPYYRKALEAAGLWSDDLRKGEAALVDWRGYFDPADIFEEPQDQWVATIDRYIAQAKEFDPDLGTMPYKTAQDILELYPTRKLFLEDFDRFKEWGSRLIQLGFSDNVSWVPSATSDYGGNRWIAQAEHLAGKDLQATFAKYLGEDAWEPRNISDHITNGEELYKFIDEFGDVGKGWNGIYDALRKSPFEKIARLKSNLKTNWTGYVPELINLLNKEEFRRMPLFASIAMQTQANLLGDALDMARSRKEHLEEVYDVLNTNIDVLTTISEHHVQSLKQDIAALGAAEEHYAQFANEVMSAPLNFNKFINDLVNFQKSGQSAPVFYNFGSMLEYPGTVADADIHPLDLQYDDPRIGKPMLRRINKDIVSGELWKRNMRTLGTNLREQILGNLKHQIDGTLIHEKYHQQIANLKYRSRTLLEQVSVDEATMSPINFIELLSDAGIGSDDARAQLDRELAEGETLEKVISTMTGIAISAKQPLDPSAHDNKKARIHSTTAEFLERNPEALGNLLKGVAPDGFIKAYAKMMHIPLEVIHAVVNPQVLYEEYLAHKIQYLMHPLSLRYQGDPNTWDLMGEYFFEELGAIDKSTFDVQKGLSRRIVDFQDEIFRITEEVHGLYDKVPNDLIGSTYDFDPKIIAPYFSEEFETAFDPAGTTFRLAELEKVWDKAFGHGNSLLNEMIFTLSHQLEKKYWHGGHGFVERDAGGNVTYRNDDGTLETEGVPDFINPIADSDWGPRTDLRRAIHEKADGSAWGQFKQLVNSYEQHIKQQGKDLDDVVIPEVDELIRDVIPRFLRSQRSINEEYAPSDMYLGAIRGEGLSISGVFNALDRMRYEMRKYLVIQSMAMGMGVGKGPMSEIRNKLGYIRKLQGQLKEAEVEHTKIGGSAGHVSAHLDEPTALEDFIGPVYSDEVKDLEDPRTDPPGRYRSTAQNNADVMKDEWIQKTLRFIGFYPETQRLWDMWGSASEMQKIDAQIRDLEINGAKSQYMAGKHRELFREARSADKTIEGLQQKYQAVKSGEVPDVLQALDFPELITVGHTVNPSGTDPKMMAELWTKIYELSSRIHYGYADKEFQQTVSMENLLENQLVNRLRGTLSDDAWGPSQVMGPDGVPVKIHGMGGKYRDWSHQRKHVDDANDQNMVTFGEQVGTETRVSQEKVKNWAGEMNQNNLVPITQRLEDIVNLTVEHLKEMKRSHDLSKLDPILMQIEPGRPGVEAVEAYVPAEQAVDRYIQQAIDIRDRLNGSIEEINTVIRDARFFMEMPEGRRMLYEVMTWAGAGSFFYSPSMGFLINALEGFVDPRTVVSKLHTLEKMGRGIKGWTDDFYERMKQWTAKGYRGFPFSWETMGVKKSPRDRRRYARIRDDESTSLKLARTFVAEQGALYFSEEKNEPEVLLEDPEYAEAYQQAHAVVSLLGSNLDILKQVLDKAIEPVAQAAPEMSKEIRARLEYTVNHLYQTMPRPIPGGFLQESIPPPDYEIMKWLGRLEISEKPTKLVLYRLVHGHLTPDEIETADAVAPSTMNKIRSDMMGMIAGHEAELPEFFRNGLAILLKGTVIPPEYSGMAQAIFQGPEKEEQRPPRAKKPRIPEIAGGQVPGASFRMSEIG